MFKSFPQRGEKLTGSDFVTAVKQSESVCIIPIGVIEKHGAHLPLGTDVYTAREIAIRAVYYLVVKWYGKNEIVATK